MQSEYVVASACAYQHSRCALRAVVKRTTRKITLRPARVRGVALLGRVSFRIGQYGLGLLVVVVVVAAMLPKTPSV